MAKRDLVIRSPAAGFGHTYCFPHQANDREMLVKLLDQGTVKLNDPLSNMLRQAHACQPTMGRPLRW